MTTSTFTSAAAALALRHQVELWDGNELARILEQRKRSIEVAGDTAAISLS